MPRPKIRRGGGSPNLWNQIVSFFTGEPAEDNGGIEIYSAGDKGTKKVDTSTLDAWNDILTTEGQATTQNIGRIWTDKSVFTDGATYTQGPLAGQEIDVEGDHDFLVGLSALSSTSNTTTTTTITDPLDIILIIDRSSSMNEDIATEVRYDEAGNIVESHGHEEWILIGTLAIQDSVGGEYYVQTGENEYARVQEVTKRVNVGWTGTQYYYEHVRWEVNGQEVSPETTTFYQKTPVATSSRMEALKEAAYNFVDSAAGMPNSDLIRIGVVSFAGSSENDRNASTVNSELTSLTGNNDETIKNAISRIYAPGSNAGTYPEQAFGDASDLFRGSSDDANKVIVFFTDGGPGGTTGSLLSSSVANDTVNAALPLKQSGVTIYSVGVLDGADPLKSIDSVGTDSPEIDQVDAFMHAVSSNYPTATGFTSNLLGNRTPDSDYYKVAGDAQELNQIFEDISHELPSTEASGSPIEGTDVEGVQDAVPGTLTFTDTLGDYMEVTGDTMTLVYGDQQYSARKGNDGVYRFEDKEVGGNDVYASANLSQIQISIQEGEGSNGDTVTVSMPASFIPLRNYRVNTEDGQSTMTVSEAYPIRLFYGVSVKQDALDNLGDPSNTALQSYINKNKTENGASVNFYANKWNGGDLGDATATFTPNEANKFYYYTENTDLYVDENCNTRANQWNISQHDTLYYKDTYWVQNGTTGMKQDEVLSIARNGQDASGIEYDLNNNAYIAAGTQRYDRPATLASGKANNQTKTATQVLNPTWANANTVSQRLGNNAVLPVELPAALSITKNVNFGGDYGNGFDETPYTEDKSYEMNIHVEGVQGNYKAQVKNADGTVVSNPTDGYFDIAFDQSGNAKHSIKHGETLSIYGLDGGAQYEVTETELGTAWTTEITNGKGMLAANGNSIVTVNNTYTLNPVVGKGEQTFHGMKVLEGRDWATDGSDSFTFRITGQGGAPTPAPNTVTVSAANTTDGTNDAATFSFNDVQYTQPGVYTYTIEEIPPTDARPGISYSNAAYSVEVTVSDNQNGNMVVTSKMTQTRGDNIGDTPTGEIADKVAKFTNHFAESETTAVLGTIKDYQNKSGNEDMDLKDGMFTAELRPTGANAADAPMPESGTTGEGSDRVAIGANAGNSMNFGRIHFTNQMDGQMFTYQIREAGTDGNGMDYDESVYTVQVTVNVNDQNQVSVRTEYFDASGASLGTGDGGEATQPTFHNVYDPADATLTGDAGDAVHGDKTLTGRDMKEDESFGFTLSARNQAAQTAVANGDITIANNDWIALVSGGKNGQAQRFMFGDMTFKKAGTYTFSVSETSHNGDELPGDGTAGMTYDRDACVVTVAVTDDNGVLKAAVSYDNGADQPTDRAVFQNNYASHVDFGNTEGGVNITKQLDGRNLTAGEFQFSITAVEADGSVSIDEANSKLAVADRAFSNQYGALANTPSQAWKQLAGMTFNQNDAGETFVYEVSETSQSTDTVTTDGTVYTVALTPQDKGDGSMYVTGSVKGGDTEIAIDTRDENYTAPVLAFKNIYTPKPVSTSDDTQTTLQVTKKVTGAAAAGAFDFELTLDAVNSDNGSDGVFEDAGAKQAFDGMTVTTKNNLAKDEEQTISFDQLTFTKAGTYTFKVKETTQAPDDYWDYDNTEKTITVQVNDNNGQLVIASPVTGNNPTVENKYTAEPVVVGGEGADKQITVKKTVTGHESTSAFSFQLEPVIEQGDEEKWETVSPVDPNYDGKATINAGIAEGSYETANFGGIEFTAEGTFKFKVTEVEAHDDVADPAGWTYDTHESFATVKVTDDGKGQLQVEVEYDNSNANTTADKAERTAAAFTNSYAASGTIGGEGQTQIQVTKNFTGRANDAWLDGDQFEFTIAPDTDDAATKAAVEDGFIENSSQTIVIDDETAGFAKVFGAIKFSEPGNHTYRFIVSEVLPDGVNADSNWTKDGITYDHEARTVIVNVTDDGNGNLTPSIAAESDNLTFNNTYSTQPISFFSIDLGLEGNKVLTGREWETGDSFTFTITRGECTYPNSDTKLPDDVANATMPKNTSVTITPATDGSDTSADGVTSAHFAFGADKTVDVDEFTFSEPGTYRYLIEETNPNVAQGGSGILGVTYDETTYRLTVEVTDNGDGTLSQTHSFSKQAPGSNDWADVQSGESITFTNAFSVDEVSPSFNVYKVFNGSDQAMTDNKFEFKIAAAGWANNSDTTDAVNKDLAFDGDSSENPMPMVDGELSDTVGSIIRGDVVFGDTTFTHDNVGKTYRYAVTEVQPTVDGTIDGEGLEGASFDQSTGKWTYEGVTYDNATHYIYAKVISEQIEQPENSGTYVEAVRVYTAGEAEFNQEQQAVVGDAVFTNTYAASGSLDGDAQLGVTKKVAGTSLAANDSFHFTLKLTDTANGAAMDGVQVEGADGAMTALTDDGVTKKISGDIADGATKTVGFGKMTFTKAGDYTFTVTEDEAAGNAPEHWTYDKSAKTITVNVKDNNDGKMTVDVPAYDTTFVNTYYNTDDAKSAQTKQGDQVVADDGTMAGVGDTIHYEIKWANNAVNEQGVPVAATVQVKDAIPAHTSLVEDSISKGGTYNEQTGEITWTFENQQPGATGTVSFDVTVDESAAGATVSNKATVLVNESSVDTNPVETVIPGKTVTDESADNGLMVGDVLTYKISYANTTGTEAAMTIEDTLPDGVTYIADPQWIDSGKTGFTLQQEGQKLTWSTDHAAAVAKGTISFQVRVNEKATTVENPVANTAYVTVGDNTYKTNTTGNDEKPATGNLVVSKTVVAQNGASVDANKSFKFTIALKDAAGNDLTATYNAQVYNGSDEAVGKELALTNSGTFTLKHGEHLVVSGLPEGAVATVTEAAAGDGYAQTSPVDGDGNPTSGTTTVATGDEPATIAFTNSYTPSGTDFDPDNAAAGLGVTKNVTGNGEGDAMSKAGYEFELAVNPTDGATLPENTTASSNEDGAVDFGSITFTKVGNYDVTISEVIPTEGDDAYNEHMTYDGHDFTYTVNVTDNDHDGKLEAAVADGTVSENEGTFTNVYYDEESAKESAPAEGDTNGIQVGDVLTYTIDWANNAVDENGNPVAAAVTVTDQLPVGLKYAGTPEGATEPTTVSEDGKTLTWELVQKSVGESGTLTFKAEVTEDAVTVGKVENTATVNVGDHEYSTNTTADEVGSGDLVITKTVEAAEGTTPDKAHKFAFEVELMAPNGTDTLTGSYAIEGATNAEGTALETVKSGDTIYLTDGDKASIKGLPEGATYTVTENLDNANAEGADYGYTQTAPAADGKATPATGTIPAGGENATAAFTNAYSADPSDVPVTGDTDKAFNLTKQFTGRDGNAWLEGDEFSFTLTGNDGAPMPEGSTDGTKTVTVGADDVTDAGNGIASIDFGSISYDKVGTYTYTVTEANTGQTIDGITYASNTVEITVSVTDAGKGKLVAAVAKTGEAEGASFVNTYSSTVDYGAEGNAGLDITKQLNGRDMTAGQFSFTVTAADDASAQKLGGETVKLDSTAAVAGESSPVATNPFDAMTFTREDAGKTFTYTVQENLPGGVTASNPTAGGYTYDTDVYTVGITPEDNGDGTMKVTTEVTSEGGYNEATEGSATAPFVNTYAATPGTIGANGQVTINATKVLNNDTLSNGQFAFQVVDASNNATVATGTNAADGSIAFDDITYTTENLTASATAEGSSEVGKATLDTTGDADVYTFHYNVVEDAAGLGEGYEYNSGNGSVTVTVTDDRAGNLDIKVTYDNGGNGLTFENTYGGSAEFPLTLTGDKTIKGAEGTQPPALNGGEFGFAIEGHAAEDGTPAPMPETAYVENQGSEVSFGPITYTMENVFGTDTAADETEAAGDEAAETDEGVEAQTAGRTKVFTYTITESADKTLPGVTNDSTPKTVEVTVTDNGDGTLAAEVTGVSDGTSTGMDFSFVNTYTVTPQESTPTGNGGLTFTKVWDRQGGTRELAEGDFTFQLTDAQGNVAATGTNDAAGNVAMGAISFTQAGDYSYTLSEVVPEGAKPVEGGYEKDGVFYPNTAYAVTAHVVDNHNGTLGVTWSMADAQAEPTNTAVIANTYSVAPTSVTFGAGKVLDGRDIAEGEFSFELKDSDGNVLGTAKNAADGSVVFADAVQTFGKAGTYEYTISEVLPEDDDEKTDGIQKDSVTYDETVYTVDVTVEDNRAGNLTVTGLTYNGEATLPVFTNTYTEPAEPPAPKPEEPKPEEPKQEVIPATGDAAMLAVGATAALGAALAGGGYLARKKRGE